MTIEAARLDGHGVTKMSISTYANTVRQVVKHGYAYNDDPTFGTFRSAVNQDQLKNEEPKVPDATLYTLWYESKNFRKHWLTPYSNDTCKLLIYILGHNLVSPPRLRIMMMTWIKLSHPNITHVKLNEWEQMLLLPEWRRITNSVEQKRNKRNQKRREARMKRGRPTQQAPEALRVRILEALKVEPSTTAILAALLQVDPKAVDGHMWRMTNPKTGTGEVVKRGRGLYALRTGGN